MAAIIQRTLHPVTPDLSAPESCPKCGGQAWRPHGSDLRPILDRDLAAVEVHRYLCQICGRTTTGKPERGIATVPSRR